MLSARVIPALTMLDGELVKTKKFDHPKYIGDPLNAVRIFNEKKADEIYIADIGASRQSKSVEYSLIKKIAEECQAPLCYSGGVRDVDTVERLVGLGVEKVAFGSSSLSDLTQIYKAAHSVGSQSVLGIVNIAKVGMFHKRKIFDSSQRKVTDLLISDHICSLVNAGIGELILNFVDLDGMRAGFEIDYISKIYKQIDIPVTVVGGAKDFLDIYRLAKECVNIGIGVGRFFLFQGKFDAVLIKYLTNAQRQELQNIKSDFVQ